MINAHNNGCAEAGCGLPPISPQHDVMSSKFQHRYLGARSKRRREARNRAPKLCDACATGKHDGRKTEIGCVELVAKPPRDFVCGCEICKTVAIPVYLLRRSDTQGVIQCRF